MFFYALLASDGATVVEWRSYPQPMPVGSGAAGEFANMRAATTQEAAALNPSPTLAQQLAPTDYKMARAAEDLIVLLLSKGAAAKTDLSPSVLADINARRAIRGQTQI